MTDRPMCSIDGCEKPATTEYQTCEVRFYLNDEGQYEDRHDIIDGQDSSYYCDDHA